VARAMTAVTFLNCEFVTVFLSIAFLQFPDICVLAKIQPQPMGVIDRFYRRLRPSSIPPAMIMAEKEAGSGTLVINITTLGASTTAPPVPPSLTAPEPFIKFNELVSTSKLLEVDPGVIS
jgi:hypothetical protein